MPEAKWETWNPVTGCVKISGGCQHCLYPDTPVLMADMSWRPIREVREGDDLVGFTESPKYGQNRLSCRSRVIRTWRTRAEEAMRHQLRLPLAGPAWALRRLGGRLAAVPALARQGGLGEGHDQALPRDPGGSGPPGGALAADDRRPDGQGRALWPHLPRGRWHRRADLWGQADGLDRLPGAAARLPGGRCPRPIWATFHGSTRSWATGATANAEPPTKRSTSATRTSPMRRRPDLSRFAAARMSARTAPAS